MAVVAVVGPGKSREKSRSLCRSLCRSASSISPVLPSRFPVLPDESDGGGVNGCISSGIESNEPQRACCRAEPGDWVSGERLEKHSPAGTPIPAELFRRSGSGIFWARRGGPVTHHSHVLSLGNPPALCRSAGGVPRLELRTLRSCAASRSLFSFQGPPRQQSLSRHLRMRATYFREKWPQTLHPNGFSSVSFERPATTISTTVPVPLQEAASFDDTTTISKCRLGGV